MELLYTSDSEYPSAVQLFGSDPELFYRAAKHAALQKFDVLDVNMGCPAPKIVKNGEGSALMTDAPRVKAIVEALVSAAPNKTVTAKIRAGFEKVNAPEIAMAVEKGGAAAVTVHPRLRGQYYFGKADRSIIREVKKAVKIPVVGSGDVKSREDYEELTERYGCDFVMIGRAAVGRPSIFSEILDSESNQEDGGGRIRQDLEYHIDVLLRRLPEKHVLNAVKKHVAAYAKGRVNAALIREMALSSATLSELLDIIKDF